MSYIVIKKSKISKERLIELINQVYEKEDN